LPDSKVTILRPAWLGDGLTEFEMRCTAEDYHIPFLEWLKQPISEQCMAVALRRSKASMRVLTDLDAAKKAKQKEKKGS